MVPGVTKGTSYIILLRISNYYGGNMIMKDFFPWNSKSGKMTTSEATTTNANIEKGKSIPSVTWQEMVIKKDGKELNSYCCERFCYRTLKIDDTHTLEVKIEPGKYNEKSKVFVLQNCGDVENYLLGLDNSLAVNKVYDTVIQLLGFSEKDISNSNKILVSYNESVGKKIVSGEKF